MNLSGGERNVAGGERGSLVIPVVTLKRFVRKRPRPELGRYAKKREIEGYNEILTAKTVRFIERDNSLKRFKSTKNIRTSIRLKSKKSPVMTQPSQTMTQFFPSSDELIVQNIIISRKPTPEPRVIHIEICRGKTMGDVNNCEEPGIPWFTTKPHRIIILPDIVPIKHTFKKAHKKINHNFKLIQEDMNCNR